MPPDRDRDIPPLLRQRDLARAVGLSTSALQRTWASAIPASAIVGRPTRKRYTLDAVAAVVGAMRARALDEATRRLVAPGDGDDCSSPALERYRSARAGLAELELRERSGDLLSRPCLESQWNAGAVALRNAGDRLQRRFGDEAAELYNEGMADFARAVTQAIQSGTQRPAGSPSDPIDPASGLDPAVDVTEEPA